MPKITEVWAFIAEDNGPNDEGVAAYHSSSGWLPMIGADPARVDSLRPIAEVLARATGKRIRLVRFSVRTDEEIIDP